MTHLLGFDLVSDFFRDEGSNKLIHTWKVKSRSLRGRHEELPCFL